MNIEQHVPKLETCQKLQEAGWGKKTVFYYVEGRIVPIDRFDEYTYSFEQKSIGYPCCCTDYDEVEEATPAPLLSELLEVLPSGVVIDKNGGESFIMRRRHTAQKWRGETPAEAAAQLVLTLVEEGILTL